MIKRFFFAAMIWCLPLAGGAQQIPPLGIGGWYKKPAATYTGPGDVVASATGFWSCARAYSAATRGTKACNICTLSGGVCADVSSSAITGIVAAPVISGTACNNSTAICTVATMYDQTGNGYDLAQGTQVNQPTVVVTAQGSAAFYLRFSGYQYMGATAVSNLAQPYSYVMYGERDSSSTIATGFSDKANKQAIEWGNSTSVIWLVGGSVLSATASDGAWHAFTMVNYGGSSVIDVDGSVTTGSSGTVETITGAFCYGGYGANCSTSGGGVHLFTEVGIWPIAFSPTQYGNLNTNLSTFY